MMSDTEAAWFAGIFDGEGTIRWGRANNVRTVSLMITNTSFDLIDKIREVTGTGLVTDKKGTGSPKHSPARTWTCHGINSQRLLAQIEGWLIVKKHGARVALGLEPSEVAPLSQRSKTRQAAEAAFTINTTFS